MDRLPSTAQVQRTHPRALGEGQGAGTGDRQHRWAAGYFPAVAVVLNRVQQLREAERELPALGIDGRLYDRRFNRDRLDDRGAGGYDMSFVDCPRRLVPRDRGSIASAPK